MAATALVQMPGKMLFCGFVALAAPEGTYVRRLYKDKWGRERIKHAAANHAFDMVRRYLTGLPVEFDETC